MTTGRINQVAIGVSKTVNQTRVRQVGPIRPHCHGKPPWREPGQTSTGPATILVLDRLHVPPSITRLYLYFQCCRQKRGQMTPLLALPSSREGRPRASECRQPSICSVKNTSRGTRHSRIVPTNKEIKSIALQHTLQIVQLPTRQPGPLYGAGLSGHNQVH